MYGLMDMSNMSFTSKYWNEKKLFFPPLSFLIYHIHHREKRLRFSEEVRKSAPVHVRSLWRL